MRTFLGVLMVLIVSGDADQTINGDVGESVLLPCNCLGRNLDEEFLWQTEGLNSMLVFKYNGNTSEFYGRYKGRASIFLSENSENCSVLLTNITAEDQAKYRCKFFQEEEYIRHFVHLYVSAPYTVCQTPRQPSGSVNVYQCNVTGRYRNATIQWTTADGQLLRNLSTTNITHTYTLDATGFYRFNSKLSTTVNWTPEPTCKVTAKDISTNIRTECPPAAPRPSTGQLQDRGHWYLIILPMMLVLGLSLLLWHRWDSSQRLLRIREVETDNFYC